MENPLTSIKIVPEHSVILAAQQNGQVQIRSLSNQGKFMCYVNDPNWTDHFRCFGAPKRDHDDDLPQAELINL